MQVKTLNLTWSAAQLKQNITEDDKRVTSGGKQRYKPEDDMSLLVRNKEKVKAYLVWSRGCVKV